MPSSIFLTCVCLHGFIYNSKYRPQERFESHVNDSDPDTNPSTFHICERPEVSAAVVLIYIAIVDPVTVTPSLLSVETDWGAVDVTSANATISPDPTVDPSIYTNVTFTSTSLKLNTGIYDKKFVIP